MLRAHACWRALKPISSDAARANAQAGVEELDERDARLLLASAFGAMLRSLLGHC